MSPLDPKKPSHPIATTWHPQGTPRQALVTESGVTVVVKDIPTPEPVRRDPWPPQSFPRVVIVPTNQPARDRDAFMRELYAQHGEFIRHTLLRRGDVLEESTKDLQQRVLLIIHAHAEAKTLPENVRGFIVGVIRKEVSNHKRRRAPKIDNDADADVEASSAPGPETAAQLAERRAKLAHYLTLLAPEEAEAVRLVDIEEMTIDEAAQALQRPRGTVSTQLTRAREKLRDFARAPDRATALGVPRRSGG